MFSVQCVGGGTNGFGSKHTEIPALLPACCVTTGAHLTLPGLRQLIISTAQVSVMTDKVSLIRDAGTVLCMQ